MWRDDKKNEKQTKTSMSMKKQVNRHVDINDNVSFSITNYSEDGYAGILKDTEYADGYSYTNWCEFYGTEEECKKYIAEKENK